MTSNASPQMTLLDPFGWTRDSRPRPLEAFVDALALVYELVEDPNCPLFQECLSAAELTLLHANDRGDQTTIGLTSKLWDLRQRVLSDAVDDGSLQSYILDVMLSIGIGLLVSLEAEG